MQYTVNHLTQLNNYRFKNIGIKVTYCGSRVKVESRHDKNETLQKPFK